MMAWWLDFLQVNVSLILIAKTTKKRKKETNQYKKNECKEYENNIYLKGDWINKYESDPSGYGYYLTRSKSKAWKDSGVYGILTRDLCDTGKEVYKLS